MTTASATALVPRLSTTPEARATVFDREGTGEVASELFVAGQGYDLSGHCRHWRNAGTQTSHDPADRKYHQAGNHLLTSVAPPNHGQI